MLVAMVHPSTYRMVVHKFWAKAGVLVGSTLVYTITSYTMLPNVHHMGWMVHRFVAIVWCTLFDAIAASQNLRLTPGRFNELYKSKYVGQPSQ
jgi:hypothetical protein